MKFLVLGKREERHTVKEGEERRGEKEEKWHNRICSLSKNWLRTRAVGGSCGLQEKQMDYGWVPTTSQYAAVRVQTNFSAMPSAVRIVPRSAQ